MDINVFATLFSLSLELTGEISLQIDPRGRESSSDRIHIVARGPGIRSLHVMDMACCRAAGEKKAGSANSFDCLPA